MKREEEEEEGEGSTSKPPPDWENSRTGQGRRVFLGRWSHGREGDPIRERCPT